MFSIIRPAGHYRIIDEGRVFCPTRRRDVELDVCAGCAVATEIQPDLEHPYVRCRPEPAIVGLAQWLL